MSQGGGGKGAVELQQVESSRTVRMAAEMLDCHACQLPLKRPIFKCDGEHLVCSSCRGVHGQACDRPVVQSALAEAFAAAAFVPCDYERYGCDPGYIVYHEAANHRLTCQHAPCGCPERCGFSGSPINLLKHITPEHSRTAIVVRYGKPLVLSLPLSEPWQVLIGEKDEADRHQNVFLVSVGDGGAEVEVSLVCIRANAGVPSEFSCEIAVEHSDDGTRQTLVSPVMKTSSLSNGNGTPAPGEVKCLTVKKGYLSGDIVPLTILIDRLAHPPPPPFSPTSLPFSPARPFSPKSPPFSPIRPFSPKPPYVASPPPSAAAEGKGCKRSRKGSKGT
ncbi:unnamed protein product [Alopecurus aequalis]